MGEEQGLSLRDTLSIFFRRIYLLYVMVVLLPLAALITCLVVDPVYESYRKDHRYGKERNVRSASISEGDGGPDVFQLERGRDGFEQ